MDGMLRLSEACAKLRLSSVVEKQDAEIAMGITTYYLDTMCMDPGTKKYNQDIATGGETATQKKVRLGLMGFIEANLDILTENNANGWIDLKELKSTFMEEMSVSEKDFNKALREAQDDQLLVLKGNLQKLEYKGEKKRGCTLDDEYK
jgi:DNA replicative helicase MCM subunit Mcm2 (Cdc46/Mcm family)